MDGRANEQEKIEKFGLRLKKLRQEKGISQEALAVKAEIPVSQVARIETARINPTLTTISAIARALDMSLSDFFDNEV